MNYLLDTNIVSEIRKRNRCQPSVARWYGSADDKSLYLSALVLGELQKGVELARATDKVQAAALSRWLEGLKTVFVDRVLPIDASVSEEWGRMNALRPIPVVDGLMAATAKVHGMVFVTRDTGDVANLGVELYNPFEEARR